MYIFHIFICSYIYLFIFYLFISIASLIEEFVDLVTCTFLKLSLVLKQYSNGHFSFLCPIFTWMSVLIVSI